MILKLPVHINHHFHCDRLHLTDFEMRPTIQKPEIFVQWLIGRIKVEILLIKGGSKCRQNR